MNYETIKLDNNGPVWTLTLSRPESLNALNSQVLTELDQALSYLSGLCAAEARVLILTGSGEKAFVAGADIKEMKGLSVADAEKFGYRGQAVFRKIEHLKIPVIAAVNGFALGGGLELALACDFIYASDNAKLGLPEVTLGLIPGFGGTVRLSRVVGLAKAKEWIFTGGMVGAADAVAMGLVNKVLPASELMPAVFKVAQTIASRAPIALSNAKKSVMRSFDQDIDAGMQTEAHFFGQLFGSQDTAEGINAFVEKRKAEFKGH